LSDQSWKRGGREVAEAAPKGLPQAAPKGLSQAARDRPCGAPRPREAARAPAAAARAKAPRLSKPACDPTIST